MNANAKKVVGVLGLQGCVQPHKLHLDAAGAEFLEIKKADQLTHIHGLILPGGESGTMLKLIDLFKMEEALLEVSKRIPFWGICAGSILMAGEVTNPAQKSWKLLDIKIKRNAYGRQQESFECELNFSAQVKNKVAFIRAPKIESVYGAAQVRAEYEGSPVWVEQGRHMVTTFHPELSLEAPSAWHKSFVSKC